MVSSKRRGATMVLVVVLMPVLFALAAIAVNLAYIQVVNTRIQFVVDAAARSAGYAYVEAGTEAAALAAAQASAANNPIDSFVLPLDSGDLEFGLSDRDGENQRYNFSSSSDVNAVRITTHSLAGGAGPALRPFFPVFGANFDIRPTVTATNTQQSLDICLVLDRSGSMTCRADQTAATSSWVAGDPVPSDARWLDLVAAVTIFTDELTASHQRELLSLASYAESSSIDKSLTSKYSSIHKELTAFSESYDGGSTNIAAGIEDGLVVINESGEHRNWAKQVMVLMSDGNQTAGVDPMLAAQHALDLKIPIYTVSFSDQADTVLMGNIAALTGGEHHAATTAAQLATAFQEIARSIPSLLTQ